MPETCWSAFTKNIECETFICKDCGWHLHYHRIKDEVWAVDIITKIHTENHRRIALDGAPWINQTKPSMTLGAAREIKEAGYADDM